MELATELHDILGLAYSPRSGCLYAIDSSWKGAKNGGLFRIDAATERRAVKCSVVKIAAIVRPTALAFGPDGALYITAVGELNDESTSGVLVKVSGNL
jgi:hypothetical protein